ncbi:MAG: hypothetical protein WAN65_31045 [Candidatus Sulfotelmatobacter sp.]
MESGGPERRGSTVIAGVQVEVSSHDDQGRLSLPVGVLQRLTQLPQPERVFASAFEMQVVGNRALVIDESISNQRDPAPKPSLKQFDPWYIPTGLPEVGLASKTNNPPI